MTYPTYQAAKIANPESEVYKFIEVSNDNKIFFHSGCDLPERLINELKPCNPADHCMTVAEFEDSGKKLFDGDLYINLNGNVIPYTEGFGLGVDRNPSMNEERYILKAKALEETNTIPTETPEEKEAPEEKTYRYEKVEFDKASEAVALVEDGGSFWVKKTEGLNPFWFEVCTLNGAVADWEFAHCRIEVTERELFIERGHKAIQGVPRCMDVCVEHLGAMYDAGCRFVNGKG